MGYEPCSAMQDSPAPCTLDPNKVLLNAKGFAQVLQHGNQTSMTRFIERLLQHSGRDVRRAKVADKVELDSFVNTFFETVVVGNLAWEVHGPQQTERVFKNLLESLDSHSVPGSTMRVGNESCVADRDSDEATVGNAIGMACRHIPNFDCDDVPLKCRSDIWTVADFVFGAYHAQIQRAGTRSALHSCYFEGAARLLTADVTSALSKQECVVPSHWHPPIRRLSTGLHQITKGTETYDNSENEGMFLAMFLAPFAALLAIVLCVRFLMPRPEKTRRGTLIHPPAIEELTSVEVVQLPPSSSSSLISTDDGN